ncbi:DMT family transporter [Brevibacillus sp. SYP-B805]|uniref:DMT family transporter n=1 Tax=Brevibacillus sp. SYP-B805 TaxID=1578199 RepID=UPI0013EA06C0|nr:DMT family transporter [Brevibacillus sp. SYP-B805]NGQ94487.1 DMT family transporter [Brevibacillus sp. SYP-B805]
MNWLMTALALLGGACIGLQAGINGQLSKKIGALEGAFVSFSVGTLLLLFALIFLGQGNLLSVQSVPKWQLTGGLLGAVYIFIATLAVPKIGVATTLLAVVTGQILTSTVIDHFGLITGNQIPLDGKRLTALLLLALALYLFYKR